MLRAVHSRAKLLTHCTAHSSFHYALVITMATAIEITAPSFKGAQETTVWRVTIVSDDVRVSAYVIIIIVGIVRQWLKFLLLVPAPVPV